MYIFYTQNIHFCRQVTGEIVYKAHLKNDWFDAMVEGCKKHRTLFPVDLVVQCHFRLGGYWDFFGKWFTINGHLGEFVYAKECWGTQAEQFICDLIIPCMCTRVDKCQYPSAYLWFFCTKHFFST